MSAPSAAQVLARALARRGVRVAFGMPGGEVLPLLDALAQEGVDFVLVRDEASAGFMADVAWQLTGAPGVAIATLGPGAVRLLPGIAGARLDRAAVVAITGQIQPHLQRVYTHQTLDQETLFRPLVKHGVTLSAGEAAREIALALRQLSLDRPGPVHLNLPADVALAPQPGALDDAFTLPPSWPSAAAIHAASEALTQARRPLLLVGPADRSDALADALGRLLDRVPCPALTTYRARGLVDEAGPWSAGAFGLSPVVDALQQELVRQADLLLLVGYDASDLRPQWLPGWAPQTPVIALDTAPPADLLGPVAHLLVGPLSGLIDALCPEGGATTWSASDLDGHRARLAAPFEDGASGPATAIRALQAAFPEDTLLSLDVGAHRITANHVWRCRRPGRQFQSNGLASMGFGLPAAITTALLRPGQPTLCVTGDMGLQMALGELGVAQDRGLSLTVAVLRDDSLALIELKQARMGLPPVGVRFRNPEITALAAAFGGVGVTARGPDEIRQAATEALARGGLTLLDLPIDATCYRQQM